MLEAPFLLRVEGVFTITGRGTVVTGCVERGVLRVNDDVEIVGLRAQTTKSTCIGIEIFRKVVDEVRAGDNAGVLLRGVRAEDVERGQVLVKPGSMAPHTEFECELYVLTKEEGGRHTPFVNGYMPQFFFRTSDGGPHAAGRAGHGEAGRHRASEGRPAQRHCARNRRALCHP